MKILKLLIIGAVVSLCIVSCDAGYAGASTKFDSQKWLVGDSLNENLRYDMIDDLTQKHLFKGASKSDIVKLLGNCFFVKIEGSYDGDNTLLYEIGRIEYDRCFLNLHFDENDKLIESQVLFEPSSVF